MRGQVVSIKIFAMEQPMLKAMAGNKVPAILTSPAEIIPNPKQPTPKSKLIRQYIIPFPGMAAKFFF